MTPPFLDAKKRKGGRLSGAAHFNPNQPRGGNGRWVSVGTRLQAAATLSGGSVTHVPFSGVRRPAELAKRFGVSVSGFKHAASDQAMRHALKQHGNPATEKARGQKAITPDDFARLPEIIRRGVYHEADQRKFGPKRIEIRATLGADRYVYVGEVRTGARRIDMVTMWKR